MKIITNLICLNSEPELPALLDSLKGKVDGLVAVDGGSTDKTVELLAAWGDATGIPVFIHKNPWPDDFSVQRNLCLDITRQEYGNATPENDVWVLMIDSDDTLVEWDRPWIESAVDKAGVSGLLCRMDNANGFFNFCQLFRLTADAAWKNPIHEYILSEGNKGMPPVGTVTIKRGRSAQHDQDPLRNVRIGRKFLETDMTNQRVRFYLARDLLECPAVPLEQRRAESEGHLRTYLSHGGDFLHQDRYALLLLVRILTDTGRFSDARELLIKAIDDDPDNRSAFEALGRITMGKESGVWQRLAAAAEGSCILPHSSKLPEKVVEQAAVTQP